MQRNIGSHRMRLERPTPDVVAVEERVTRDPGWRPSGRSGS
jgi:hypothetical protein